MRPGLTGVSSVLAAVSLGACAQLAALEGLEFDLGPGATGGSATGTGGTATGVGGGGTGGLGGGGTGGAGTAGQAGAGGEAGAGGTGPGPLPEDARVVFLHHGTGDIIWDGGVPAFILNYNADQGKSYETTDYWYPHTPYLNNNFPYDYWHLWVEGAGPTAYEGQETLEMLTPQYRVIVFKHCYPVSDIQADTASGDVTSPVKTIANYVLQYEALKAKLRTFPDNRFILWTGAAREESDTTPAEAARARTFFDWVTGTWDEPGDNIYLWDFFELETEGGNYLRLEHSTGAGSSYPNTTFAQTVAPYLGQRIVDVIEGRGDTGSMTGQ